MCGFLPFRRQAITTGVRPGGTTTENVIVDNPAAGDWYLLAYGYSAYSGVTVTASFGSADLAAAAWQVGQTTVAAGDVLTATLSVTNQGSVYSDATEVYFYFRTNLNDYSSVAYVGELYLAALNAGAATGLQFTYVLPMNTPAGAYALSYWIDGPGWVTESNKNNNVGTWAGISVTAAAMRQLTNGVAWSGQAGLQGSQKLYKITSTLGPKVALHHHLRRDWRLRYVRELRFRADYDLIWIQLDRVRKQRKRHDHWPGGGRLVCHAVRLRRVFGPGDYCHMRPAAAIRRREHQRQRARLAAPSHPKCEQQPGFGHDLLPDPGHWTAYDYACVPAADNHRSGGHRRLYPARCQPAHAVGQK